MMSDNIIIELYKLSRNMNWTQIKLSIFCQNFLWHEGERARKS